LLHADDGQALDRAWSGFVEEYGRLILHVARAQGGQHDDIMDRYTYVLEQLRRSISAGSGATCRTEAASSRHGSWW
jgi:hypothetical protein